MKKVLFATTALVATAGVAAADVTFGGYGRFGAIYTETKGTAAGGTPEEVQSDSHSALSNYMVTTGVDQESRLADGPEEQETKKGQPPSDPRPLCMGRIFYRGKLLRRTQS